MEFVSYRMEYRLASSITMKTNFSRVSAILHNFPVSSLDNSITKDLHQRQDSLVDLACIHDSSVGWNKSKRNKKGEEKQLLFGLFLLQITRVVSDTQEIRCRAAGMTSPGPSHPPAKISTIFLPFTPSRPSYVLLPANRFTNGTRQPRASLRIRGSPSSLVDQRGPRKARNTLYSKEKTAGRNGNSLATKYYVQLNPLFCTNI